MKENKSKNKNIILYNKLIKVFKDNGGWLIDGVYTLFEIAEGIRDVKHTQKENEREIKRLELLYKEYIEEGK
jgi:hypothetical protein